MKITRTFAARMIPAIGGACVLLAAVSALAFPAKEVYRRTARSVVLIVATEGGGTSNIGTGSILTDSGQVITNAHVVVNAETGQPYARIRVYTKPERVSGSFKDDLVKPHEARISLRNSDLDLALLNVDGLATEDGKITLANADEIMVGEEVVAIGHPEQGGLWALTYGRISGQLDNQSNVRGKDVFQTDTSVNRGNSGGPLLDRRGYLVGVNTNIARKGSGDLAITGVNFAVKSSVVKKWLAGSGVSLAYGTESIEEQAPMVATAQPAASAEAPKPPFKAPPPAATVPAPPLKQAEPTPVPAPPVLKPAVPSPAPAPPVKKAEPAPVPAPPVKQAATTPVPVPAPAAPVQKLEPAPAPAPPVKPQATPKVSPPRAGETPEEGEDAVTEGEGLKSGTILTPVKPYSFADLISEVEKEMEDLEDEMRLKIQDRKRKR